MGIKMKTICVQLLLLLATYPTEAFGLLLVGNVLTARSSPSPPISLVQLAAQSDSQDFLDKASKLRQEALDLENRLRLEKGETVKKNINVDLAPPVYKDTRDSAWTISYLFSDYPAPKDDKNSENQNIKPSTRFGGKLTLLFKEDGFTEIVSHDSSKADAGLEIAKVWGWDLERSNEDDKDYLLFSVDTILPSGSKERYYFQARQECNKSGEISLVEGTVTLKQDVSQSGSRWGLFSPAGILAEFRYVGDFSARPSRVS